ncbi:MAG: AAA family ATPase [Bacteroidales bacterium]|nr:AAA family ATPase [Bacteroidales bacterium]
MYIPRQISSKIQSIKDGRNGRIMVFTGARQVGKTTLSRNLMKDYVYISIEDPVMRSQFAMLTASQWEKLYPKALLDEVQKAPQLIESIKSVYDQYDEPRYVLLGSSQLLLLQKVRESLAGRCSIFSIYPFDIPELLYIHTNRLVDSVWQIILQNPTRKPDLLPSFMLDPLMPQKVMAWNHYLKFGGYPAIVAPDMTDDDRYLWLDNYTRTYLERDVRDLASFRDLEPFVKLQYALAVQTGNLVNASALGNSIGVSSKTVSRYLEYLNMSFQTLSLQSWERNAGKRLVKAPKIHYLDNGVLQTVLHKRGGITGAEFESLIVAEIYKQVMALAVRANFYHLRTSDGREIDLLVELPEGYFAFEMKMAARVTKNDARHLLTLPDMLDKPLIAGFVLSNDPQTQFFSDNVVGVNVNMFLS